MVLSENYMIMNISEDALRVTTISNWGERIKTYFFEKRT